MFLKAKFLSGRCPRRLGMETCPRGGFSLSNKPNDVVGSGWQWSSALFYGCCYSWLGIPTSTAYHFTYNLLPLVFALLGFLSPSNRGSLATVMMVCWSIFGRFVFLNHFLLSIFPDNSSLVSVVTFPAAYIRPSVAQIARKMPSLLEQHYRRNFFFCLKKVIKLTFDKCHLCHCVPPQSLPLVGWFIRGCSFRLVLSSTLVFSSDIEYL